MLCRLSTSESFAERARKEIVVFKSLTVSLALALSFCTVSQADTQSEDIIISTGSEWESATLTQRSSTVEEISCKGHTAKITIQKRYDFDGDNEFLDYDIAFLLDGTPIDIDPEVSPSSYYHISVFGICRSNGFGIELSGHHDATSAGGETIFEHWVPFDVDTEETGTAE